MDCTENDASHNSIVTLVFAAAVTFLPSRSLATKEGYTHRHRLMVFMMYAAELGSGAMMCILHWNQEQEHTNKLLHSILQSIMQLYSSVFTLVQHVSATLGHHQVLLIFLLNQSHCYFAFISFYMRTSSAWCTVSLFTFNTHLLFRV
jgi:hypothetical protein